MAYSIITAKVCNLPVFVSTDSSEYAAIAKDYGADIVIRPDELATDQTTDLDVIQHFLESNDCDLVVYLRPTTPFRASDRVQEAIKIMSVPGYDSLRSVEEMSESAYKCFKIRAGILQPLTSKDLTDTPNQLLQPTFKPNGYVDIVRAEIVKRGALWGVGRYAFLTPKSVEIDTEDDFAFCEYLISHKAREWEFGRG